MTANEFVKQYKIGDIVYPSAVAINCDTTMKKSISRTGNYCWTGYKEDL